MAPQAGLSARCSSEVDLRLVRSHSNPDTAEGLGHTDADCFLSTLMGADSWPVPCVQHRGRCTERGDAASP